MQFRRATPPLQDILGSTTVRVDGPSGISSGREAECTRGTSQLGRETPWTVLFCVRHFVKGIGTVLFTATAANKIEPLAIFSLRRETDAATNRFFYGVIRERLSTLAELCLSRHGGLQDV